MGMFPAQDGTSRQRPRTGRRRAKFAGISLAILSFLGTVATAFTENTVEHVVEWLWPGTPAPPGPRQWRTSDLPINIKGVSAWGDLRTEEDDRVQLTGQIKDTESDARGVQIKVVAHYSNGRTEEKVAQNGSGHNAIRPIGGNQGFTFGPGLRSLTITECLLEHNEHGQLVEYQGSCAAPPHQLWP